MMFFRSRMLRALNSCSPGIVSYWNLLVIISSNNLQSWRMAGQWKQFLTPHFKEMKNQSRVRRPTSSFLEIGLKKHYVNSVRKLFSFYFFLLILRNFFFFKEWKKILSPDLSCAPCRIPIYFKIQFWFMKALVNKSFNFNMW